MGNAIQEAIADMAAGHSVSRDKAAGMRAALRHVVTYLDRQTRHKAAMKELADHFHAVRDAIDPNNPPAARAVSDAKN